MIQRRRTPRPKALWKQIEESRCSELTAAVGSSSAAPSPEPLRSNSPFQWPRRSSKRLSQLSSKQRARLALYRKQRAIFLERRQCAVFPKIRATEIHHVRGRLGTLLLDERFWLPVSRRGHQWIDANRRAAQERGWLAQKGEWNEQTSRKEFRG